MASPFKLQPNPTFKTVVAIPRHDEEDGKLTITFKHRAVDEFSKMTESYAKKAAACKSDEKLFDLMAEHIMDIATAWAFPDAFNKANVRTLLLNYSQAYVSITEAYRIELIAGRVKN